MRKKVNTWAHLVSNPINQGLFYLMLSALLFSLMGVCVRFVSSTMDSYSIVFFRNIFGLLFFLPILFKQKLALFRTDKLGMHLSRSIIGLGSMYTLIYAIAHINLSNAMVFSYSSPIFIPILAWVFLKEKITWLMMLAASIGLLGLLLIAKPNEGIISVISIVGLSSCILSALVYVTVRSLAITEPVIRIVAYFCLFGAFLSAIPIFWLWREYSRDEMFWMFLVGILANGSQLLMSYAHKVAPASQIGPMHYIAIIFSGIWGYMLWHEIPDTYAIFGFLMIVVAIVISTPLFYQKFLQR